jgi:hypothetical protein
MVSFDDRNLLGASLMDQNLVASIRKNLEDKSTEGLRQACERGDNMNKSPEELEAMRQILNERRVKGNRVVLALVSAVLFGSLGAACVWWQGADGGFVFLAGVVCAILGSASSYIRDLIPRV